MGASWNLLILILILASLPIFCHACVIIALLLKVSPHFAKCKTWCNIRSSTCCFYAFFHAWCFLLPPVLPVTKIYLSFFFDGIKGMEWACMDIPGAGIGLASPFLVTEMTGMQFLHFCIPCNEIEMWGPIPQQWLVCIFRDLTLFFSHDTSLLMRHIWCKPHITEAYSSWG